MDNQPTMKSKNYTYVLILCLFFGIVVLGVGIAIYDINKKMNASYPEKVKDISTLFSNDTTAKQNNRAVQGLHTKREQIQNSPTPQPSESPSTSPSSTSTPTTSPTASPTAKPTNSPTPTPTVTPTPTPSPTPEPTNAPSPSPTPSPTQTPSPTATPTMSTSPSPTSTPE